MDTIRYRPRPLCARLALDDLWHDRRTTLALVFTVSAIVAPLLLLFGLKVGVIGALRAALLADPKTLEIVVYGNNRLPRAWFDKYLDRPEVGFLLPKTRTINATLDLVRDAAHFLEAVEVVPTAPGDPLLPADMPVPAQPTEVLLTATAARKLGLDLGAERAAAEFSEPLTAIVKREGARAAVPLSVIGILPESRLPADAVFTTLDLLVGAEDYRDGLRDDLPVVASDPRPSARRSHFNNARVYAANLDAVEVLAHEMRADGVEIRTQADRIVAVRALDRVLSFVFAVIALIASAGGAVALGGALWVDVERKRRDLALLRLVGVDNRSLVLMPIVQGLVIAAAGFLLAYGLYGLGAAAFNQVLGTQLADRGYVCRLDLASTAIAALACLGTAVLAAGAGGYRAGRVDAAECLREL